MSRASNDNARMPSLFSQAVKRLSGAIFSVALFSCAVNVLMLTGPLFMMQVYDRVLTSRSGETLIILFALVCGLYAFMAFFDFARTRVLSRSAYQFDLDLMPLAQKQWIHQGVIPEKTATRPVLDLSTVRQFVGSNAPPAFFDLPWVPLYLALVFFLHLWLGVLALCGAALVILFTLITEVKSRKPLKQSVPYEVEDAKFSQYTQKNADAIVAMGMASRLSLLWGDARLSAMAFAQQAGNVSEMMGASTKAVRLLLQSSILALGAWLAILQEISAGSMIAASIIAARALAPVDQVVGGWRNFARARLAYSRLKETLGAQSESAPILTLPAPKGALAVKDVSKLPQERGKSATAQKPLLYDVNFSLEAGDALGVVGPSASGKSVLARLLVGLWMPDRGSVRLDGAALDQWDKDVLGKHIGYLPQDVELVPGSIKNNIARFDPDAKSEDIVNAAQLAGVHDIILNLPGGYEAVIGERNTILSGGQAQRIALARAVYGQPALIVLDEPNSNLDSEGDTALTNCIHALRMVGSTIIVMAHRPSAIAAVNKILMLQHGTQIEFGPKEDVLKKVQRLNAVPKAG